MFSPRHVMALLAVLALSAKVAESGLLCPAASTDFCLNCKTIAKCDATSTIISQKECTDGEACTVLGGVITCMPSEETPCPCVEETQCDAYDPNSILICLSGGLTFINDCSLTDKTCDDGACVTTTTTVSPVEVCAAATVDGYAVITPMCTTAVYCEGTNPSPTVKPITCSSGTYFDVEKNGCVLVPPVPCADCLEGSCPDKSDCSKYYICVGGVAQKEDTCDEPTPNFDTGTSKCAAINDAVCTGNNNCILELTSMAGTTTSTVVASSDGGSTDDGSDSTTSGTVSTGDSTTSGTVSTGDSTTSGTVSTGDSTTSGTVSTGDSTTSGTVSTGDSTTTTSRPATCTAANVGQRYPYEGNCKMYVTCIQISNGNYDYVTSTCLGNLVFNAESGYCDTPASVPGCVPT